MQPRLLPAATLLLLALGCSSGDGPYGMSPVPPPPPPSGPTPTSAIDVRDNFFSPASASVAPGTTVTWTWRGSVSHNVTFEDGQGSASNRSSGSHQRSFGSAGTVRYRCTLHSTDFVSGMSGSIVVQ